jgi:hypothetical protein
MKRRAFLAAMTAKGLDFDALQLRLHPAEMARKPSHLGSHR